MFSVCIDAPRGPSFYLKNIMSQFQICYYSYLNVSKKGKLTSISAAKSGTGTLQSAGSMALFYPVSIMLQIFIEDSVIL